ncbi:MAG: hypothetical protein Q7O66_09315 [Dehalococcoidia bacterium]|nr:hypothetical protein [Dehalococcoidia bacterium]
MADQKGVGRIRRTRVWNEKRPTRNVSLVASLGLLAGAHAGAKEKRRVEEDTRR